MRWFVDILFKFALTLGAIGIMMGIFLMKEKIYLINFGLNPCIESGLTYFLTSFVLSVCPILIAKISVKKESITDNHIDNIQSAKHIFLPNYLGYFFVALSIPNVETFIFVFYILLLFIYVTNEFYFNPFLLLLGYDYYYVTFHDTKRKLLLISRKELDDLSSYTNVLIKRINDYSFIS